MSILVHDGPGEPNPFEDMSKMARATATIMLKHPGHGSQKVHAGGRGGSGATSKNPKRGSELSPDLITAAEGSAPSVDGVRYVSSAMQSPEMLELGRKAAQENDAAAGKGLQPIDSGRYTVTTRGGQPMSPTVPGRSIGQSTPFTTQVEHTAHGQVLAQVGDGPLRVKTANGGSADIVGVKHVMDVSSGDTITMPSSGGRGSPTFRVNSVESVAANPNERWFNVSPIGRNGKPTKSTTTVRRGEVNGDMITIVTPRS